MSPLLSVEPVVASLGFLRPTKQVSIPSLDAVGFRSRLLRTSAVEDPVLCSTKLVC